MNSFCNQYISLNFNLYLLLEEIKSPPVTSSEKEMSPPPHWSPPGTRRNQQMSEKSPLKTKRVSK